MRGIVGLVVFVLTVFPAGLVWLRFSERKLGLNINGLFTRLGCVFFLGIAFAGLYGSDGFIYGVLWAALSLGAMDSYAQTCPAHFRQIPPVNG